MGRVKEKENLIPQTGDNDNNTHVPDKLYGYTLQVRQMMNELITLELDKVVSTEALDDVAVEAQNITTFEQIKSVQSTNNPLTDRSAVFWKTLFNWYNYIAIDKGLLEKSVFRLVVVSDRSIISGTIPSSFHLAKTDEKAKEALLSAKQAIYGKNEELKDNIPDSYRNYVTVLFNEQNIEKVAKIIKLMDIVIYTEDFDKKLYEKFCSQPIASEYAEELFIYMLGWVHEQVNQQIKKGLPAYIRCNSFRDELVAQIRRYNQNTMLAWTTVNLSENEAQHELKRRDTYIKQLDFIELDVSNKLQAASYYLRTSAQKTFWAEKGLVAPQSFDEYYDGLERMWQIQLQLVLLEANKKSDASNGKKLYFKCQENTQNAKVEGKNTPAFFGLGSLHTLANVPKIGWHKNYKRLLNLG